MLRMTKDEKQTCDWGQVEYLMAANWSMDHLIEKVTTINNLYIINSIAATASSNKSYHIYHIYPLLFYLLFSSLPTKKEYSNS